MSARFLEMGVIFSYIFSYIGLGGADPILVSNFVVLYFCFFLCIALFVGSHLVLL
jgi:hypothetical protein